MPGKRMRTFFFKSLLPPPSSSSPSPSPSPSSSSSSPHTSSESVVSDCTDEFAPLFCDGRRPSQQYLMFVRDLHSSMLTFFKDNNDDASTRLLRAQSLLQSAMNTLDKEFRQILASTIHHHLHPYSVSVPSSLVSIVSDFDGDVNPDIVNSDRVADKETAPSQSLSDLKAIADCMLATGYGKECVGIYKFVRKSILEEALHQLGVEGLVSTRMMQKMEWDMLDLKIGQWLKASRQAVITLFHGERILCDMVFFSASPAIRDSCFTDITKEAMMSLLELPEIVAKRKKSPEKIFRTLDVYEAMFSLIPHIKSMLSMAEGEEEEEEEEEDIVSHAAVSLTRLADSVRSMLADFEAAMEKEASKSPIQGGGLHPLTRYVMNYLCLLSDYSSALSEILVEERALGGGESLPEAVFAIVNNGEGGGESSSKSGVSVRVAWLILVLLCKLDGKAGAYKDASLAYIFLCNNLQYVVKKAQGSNLGRLLGEGWVRRQEAQVRRYAGSYERMAWSKVMGSMPEIEEEGELPGAEEAKELMTRFNANFEETCKRQRCWVVTDAELRDEIKKSVARKLSPYRDFYDRFREELGDDVCLIFSPDNLDNYISDLFHGGG